MLVDSETFLDHAGNHQKNISDLKDRPTSAYLDPSHCFDFYSYIFDWHLYCMPLHTTVFNQRDKRGRGGRPPYITRAHTHLKIFHIFNICSLSYGQEKHRNDGCSLNNALNHLAARNPETIWETLQKMYLNVLAHWWKCSIQLFSSAIGHSIYLWWKQTRTSVSVLFW